MRFAKYVKFRKEKFGSVIFETLTEKVFVTNKIGADILNLLTESKTQDEIINLLKDDYNEDLTRINKDVISFIDQLKENKILVE